MTTPDRRHRLLDGIDIGNARGLEFGAVCNPHVSEGDFYDIAVMPAAAPDGPARLSYRLRRLLSAAAATRSSP